MEAGKPNYLLINHCLVLIIIDIESVVAIESIYREEINVFNGGLNEVSLYIVEMQMDFYLITSGLLSTVYKWNCK